METYQTTVIKKKTLGLQMEPIGGDFDRLPGVVPPCNDIPKLVQHVGPSADGPISVLSFARFDPVFPQIEVKPPDGLHFLEQ